MAALTSLALGGAVLGGVAGAISGGSDKVTRSKSVSGIQLDPASMLERRSQSISYDALNDLRGLTRAGAGSSDVSAFTQALRDVSQTGGLPQEGDIESARGFAADLFEAQRLSQQQSFSDQLIAANRQAATMGRDINDPILRAKLIQEQTRQQNLLGAQETGLASQIAMNLPQQRLQAGGMLASQAFQNRAALFGAGQQALGAERQFRLATGTRYGNQTNVQEGNFAQALSGGITGALGGAGSGMQIGNLFARNDLISGLQARLNPSNQANSQRQTSMTPVPKVNPYGINVAGSQQELQRMSQGYPSNPIVLNLGGNP